MKTIKVFLKDGMLFGYEIEDQYSIADFARRLVNGLLSFTIEDIDKIVIE